LRTLTREEEVSYEGDIQEQVKDYYGRILSTRHDLKTSACCSTESFPASHRAVLVQIDDEILDKFYACGSVIGIAMTDEDFAVACRQVAAQTATYLGTIPDHPHRFSLDDHLSFVTGKPVPVCGNSAAMLQETRFGRHFRVTGDRSVHFGPFACGPADAGCGSGSCC